jgi:WXXGXW repeat (2 copies)
MKKSLLGVAMAAMLFGGGLFGTVVVRTAPPPLRSTRVIGRAPHPGWAWTGGYWGWSRGRYAWMPGRWAAPPRRNARWVSPRWRRGRRGYTFTAGRWR